MWTRLCMVLYLCCIGSSATDQFHQGKVLATRPNCLHWGSELEERDHPLHASCSHPVSVGDMPDDSDLINYEQAISADENCPLPETNYPIYLSDPSDCSAFYQCLHGVSSRLRCANGLTFNAELSVCENSEQDGCAAPEAGGHASCPEAKAPECPAEDPKLSVLLPHPAACDWYFECSNGAPYCMPCPKGQHFNPKLETCDFPGNAGCGRETTLKMHPQ